MSPSPATVPYALPRTEIRTLPRAANGRDYLLYIGLPPSYGAEPDRKYPVLYMCDGYWDFPVVDGMVGNLVYDKAVPEFIVVGFGYAGEKPNVDLLRRGDYGPVDVPSETGHGQAGKFLAVVREEIIPFVENTYRVDRSYRVLSGSSAGGEFTLFALLEEPSLFRAYIAISPGVQYASGWIFHEEEAFAKMHRTLDARLFLSGATAESPAVFREIKRFSAQLTQRSYQHFDYMFREVDGERHAGTKAEGYSRGLRFAFAPIAPVP